MQVHLSYHQAQYLNGIYVVYIHPSLKHDRTPWVDAQEGNQHILLFVTSTSILAPASVKSMEGFLRSEHRNPLQSNFPPSKSVIVIYDIICGNLFILFFICDLNKQSGTSLLSYPIDIL